MAHALKRPYAKAVLGLTVIDWIGKGITEYTLPLSAATLQSNVGKIWLGAKLIITGLIQGDIGWTRVHHIVPFSQRLILSGVATLILISLLMKFPNDFKKSNYSGPWQQLHSTMWGLLDSAMVLMLACILGNGIDAAVDSSVIDWIQIKLDSGVITPNLSDLYGLAGLLLFLVYLPLQIVEIGVTWFLTRAHQPNPPIQNLTRPYA
jgi:hypothetical protein